SAPTIRPLDEGAVLAAAEARVVITVEEHWVHGGLGEACGTLLLEAGKSVTFRRVGFPDESTVTGSQAEIFRHYGLTGEALAGLARDLL
ncbi:MAG: transketolase C-terminal domain-containing protein, partial [Verrucomicrobiales bacterium]